MLLLVDLLAVVKDETFLLLQFKDFISELEEVFCERVGHLELDKHAYDSSYTSRDE